MAVGGWRLAVGGAWGLTLRAVWRQQLDLGAITEALWNKGKTHNNQDGTNHTSVHPGAIGMLPLIPDAWNAPSLQKVPMPAPTYQAFHALSREVSQHQVEPPLSVARGGRGFQDTFGAKRETRSLLRSLRTAGFKKRLGSTKHISSIYTK